MVPQRACNLLETRDVAKDARLQLAPLCGACLKVYVCQIPIPIALLGDCVSVCCLWRVLCPAGAARRGTDQQAAAHNGGRCTLTPRTVEA
jgi:hypothetical protein